MSMMVVTAAWTAIACAYDYVERDDVIMYYHATFAWGAHAASGCNGNVATCDAGTMCGSYCDASRRALPHGG